jgi:hypothetical protein
MRVRRRTLMLLLLLLAIGAFDGFLLLRRARYRDETTRLRAGMSTLALMPLLPRRPIGPS